MKTLKEQTDAKMAQTRSAKPEFMKKVDELILKAKDFNKGKLALGVDAIAPNFELPDAQAQKVELSSLLKRGPVVLTFYRGSWCPYCNLQLKALSNVLPEIQHLGAQLVAISPEVPDGSMPEVEISKLGFSVLSDQNAEVANSYGIAAKVPQLLLDHMKNDRELDLSKVNNGNADILPIPATFIITKEAKIAWRFVDVDYRTRSEPSEIIQELKKLL